jgi:class 3 adenylate cyclase
VGKEFYYYWEWRFQTSPEAFWPYFADTNRFNYDRGNPALVNYTKDERKPNGKHTLGMEVKGIPQVYEEEPFEWVRPLRHSVKRRFLTGFFADMRLLAELKPTPEGGSIGSYKVWVTSRGLLGRLLTPFLVGSLTYRLFDRAFRKYDRLAASGERAARLYQEGKVSWVPGGRERLSQTRDDLLARGADTDLVARLVDLIARADDLSTSRVRPYQLADAWEVPRRAALELCLLGTRAGMLEFRWELLCPLCRGSKAQAEALGSLPNRVHCATCNIEVTANFERSVELTFRPNGSIRRYELNDYCVAGPEVSPHVVVQQLLKPGERRDLTFPLEVGRYRMRALELPGGRFIAAELDGEKDVVLTASAQGWPDDELRIATRPTFVHLANDTADEQLFILERMAWSDQAATAAEVTALQAFRDLFASEALRPGEQVTVGSMTIAFTDLRESTRMYREIGDARAFGLVMSHFDILKNIIAEQDGAIVKTIGDSVMAVFRRPANALRAMLQAQRILSDPAQTGHPFSLRVGIHYGPCVAVNLNDRLDYFGSTVNIASRLEALSTGGEIVISDVIRRDPEVTALLGELADRVVIESVKATLKGFEQEKFDLYLVAPKEGVSLVI